MKAVYIILYSVSMVLFLISMLGSSLTEGLITSYSERILDYSGLKRNYIRTVDTKIDDLIYKSKQIELKIEKIKNIFSPESVDESKYQREQSSMLEKNIYSPLINLLNKVLRLVIMFISFMVLMFAIVFHFIHYNADLRKRISRLEALLNTGKAN